MAGNPLNTFTQDFNTNFLQTSNSGIAMSEFVRVSQNHEGEFRRQQDPNPPAEEPESSESRNENESVQSAKLVEIRLMPQSKLHPTKPLLSGRSRRAAAATSSISMAVDLIRSAPLPAEH